MTMSTRNHDTPVRLATATESHRVRYPVDRDRERTLAIAAWKAPLDHGKCPPSISFLFWDAARTDGRRTILESLIERDRAWIDAGCPVELVNAIYEARIAANKARVPQDVPPVFHASLAEQEAQADLDVLQLRIAASPHNERFMHAALEACRSHLQAVTTLFASLHRACFHPSPTEPTPPTVSVR